MAHTCFGCQQSIGDMQPHIHVDLDEWAEHVSKEPLGLGLEVVFCESCTQKGGRWHLEAHPEEVQPS